MHTEASEEKKLVDILSNYLWFLNYVEAGPGHIPIWNSGVEISFTVQCGLGTDSTLHRTLQSSFGLVVKRNILKKRIWENLGLQVLFITKLA